MYVRVASAEDGMTPVWIMATTVTVWNTARKM
jgi:hypothetical protein